LGINLAEGRSSNRPDLGKGVESGECWDFGVYMSEIGKEGGKKDAKPKTKKTNNYALNPNNGRGWLRLQVLAACQQARLARRHHVYCPTTEKSAPPQDVRNSAMALFWPVWELYWELY
jgi:hypothetical protein